jgi:6-phosphofructokinase 1
MKKRRGKIGVLTSGGDAPGMNAALRAIVRTAIYHGWEVLGIRNGYEGLVKANIQPLGLGSVGNIIQRGGTFLGTSRSKEFRTKDGRERAYNFLKAWDVSALITLGGDGTMTGAGIFSKEFPIQAVGIPCTIDNDIFGTDYSIGYDTAVNTAVQAIDKIRDTADSHGRVFVIEIMGRNTGHLALETAIAVGAEFAVIPEAPLRTKDVVAKIQEGINRGKSGSIVIVAEKSRPGWALVLADIIEKSVKRDVRAAVLGHLQRGGSPTSADRNLASRLGSRAVELVIEGANRVMVGSCCGEVQESPFSHVVGKRRYADLEKLRLVDTLSI